MYDITWTEEKIEQLRKLWDTGMSVTDIGKELGMTKNAVGGKAHRLKLPPRESPIKRNIVKTEKIRRKSLDIAAPALRLPERRDAPQPEAKLAIDIAVPRFRRGFEVCQWPIDNLGGRKFRPCGAKAKPNKPYCDDHCKLAYCAAEE